jgi:ComF family protein
MDICVGCLQDLPWLQNTCASCSVPLATDLAHCGRCQLNAPAADLCIAALAYEYPIDRLIGALKFRRHLYLARLLGELLTVRLAETFSSCSVEVPDIVVPVPLHPRRLAKRTFNQAEEIAACVSNNLGLPMRRHLLRRSKNTRAQSGLTRRSRLQNVRGAFALSADVAERRVAIVDDVITTGATTDQLARLCKANGANEVQVWAVARTGHY